MKRANYAGIETVEIVPLDPKPKRAIVLFHGFGADCMDLASLSEVVDVSVDTAWFFPNGPHQVPIGPHATGRAWFPLRLAELEARGVDFTQSSPDGMDKAVASACRLIEAIASKHSLSLQQIVIGGFSQGAMVALETALKLSSSEPGRQVQGVTLFSGSLVNEPALKEALKRAHKLRYFQSHGEMDFILPFDLAERLEADLNEAGWDGMLLPFRGSHEIPMPVLREWQSWLASLVKSK